MNQSKEIVLVKGDDWQGLYIDGILMSEDHSISIEDFAEVVGIKLSKKYVDLDWLEDNGYLPKLLENVVYQK